MIKGGGIRFPGGQPNRVRVEAAGGVIDPESWQVDDPVSMRQTLPQIIAALDSVQRARSAVRQTIDQAGQQIEVSSVPASKEWAETFASGFQSMLCQSLKHTGCSRLLPRLYRGLAVSALQPC
ncbi:hypothetical protein [Paludibacterium denitrificans]|uniref:Uncharacterized protein n=1 Tax=Paludibacterium denitrificans TaxID=2675226 RepID=A0A844GC79_9NEIS|nr:hypothetical protein [Paludibacterium denitrificans]MTD32901.1 hypothetical protein [Paludibacterium denitrificans]